MKNERGKDPSIKPEADEPINEVAADHPADESVKESTGGEKVGPNEETDESDSEPKKSRKKRGAVVFLIPRATLKCDICYGAVAKG